MGQEEIIKYLKKHSSEGNPKSGKEISNALKTHCRPSLFRLKKHGEVNFKLVKKVNGKRTLSVYWSKNGK